MQRIFEASKLNSPNPPTTRRADLLMTDPKSSKQTLSATKRTNEKHISSIKTLKDQMTLHKLMLDNGEQINLAHSNLIQTAKASVGISMLPDELNPILYSNHKQQFQRSSQFEMANN